MGWIGRVFNRKNFVKAIVFGLIYIIVSFSWDWFFEDAFQVEDNLIKSFIWFLVYFLIGTKEETWKNTFFGNKNKSKKY